MIKILKKNLKKKNNIFLKSPLGNINFFFIDKVYIFPKKIFIFRQKKIFFLILYLI